MAKVQVTGSIESLLNFYKVEKNIFGRCPYCHEAFRLSEVKLTYGKEPPRDLLSRMKKDRDRLQAQIDALEDDIADLVEKRDQDLEALNLHWKYKVGAEVDKQLKGREREIRNEAVAKSRAGQLGKTLEKIVPMFPGFGHHPYDVRPIFDPIDFVIFDGYYQGSVTDICFVEFKTGQSRMTPVQTSIRRAIDSKRVHFEEKRISGDAIEMLTKGRSPAAKRLIRDIGR